LIAAIAATIAGIIVGSIFAGILAAALLGGGVVAAASLLDNDSQTSLTENPLYIDSGMSSTNPLSV
jgi:hypothetical protein